MVDSTLPSVRPAVRAPARSFWARALHHRAFMIGAVLSGAMVFAALLSLVWTPHSPTEIVVSAKLKPPSWEHWLGTDQFGRDYLYRLIHGSQISLLIGFAAMLISGVIGTAIGVAAGYFGGRVDMVVNFVITTRLSLPVVLVALALVSLVGNSLWIVIWVLGLLIWDRFAVVMRSTTQQVRNLDYVAAAQAIGCSTPRIIFAEIMPNIVNNLIVVATVEMAHAIILEAALSFLGLGVQPPAPSWGLMIAEGKNHMLFDPWLVGIPGTALFILILSINLLGDGIRDITAPENRN